MRNWFMHCSSCCHAKRLDSSLAPFHWQTLKQESKGSLVTHFLSRETIRPRISNRASQTLQGRDIILNLQHIYILSPYIYKCKKMKLNVPTTSGGNTIPPSLPIFLTSASDPHTLHHHNTSVLQWEESYVFISGINLSTTPSPQVLPYILHCCFKFVSHTKIKPPFFSTWWLPWKRVQLNRHTEKVSTRAEGKTLRLQTKQRATFLWLISNKRTDRNHSTLFWGFSTGDTNSGQPTKLLLFSESW